MNSRILSAFVSFLPVIAMLIMWEAITQAGLIGPIFLPRLSDTLVTTYYGLISGDLIVHIRATMFRVTIGYAIGVISGISLGWLMGWYRLVHRVMSPIISVFYPIPKPAFLGLFLIWVGLGNTSNILVTSISSFFPVLFSTLAGVSGVDRLMIKMARDYNASDGQIASKIVLPGALPVIFSGMKVSLGVAFIVAVAVEMIVSPDRTGLGYIITESSYLSDTKIVFSSLIVLSVIGGVLLHFMDRIEARIIPWRQEVYIPKI